LAGTTVCPREVTVVLIATILKEGYKIFFENARWKDGGFVSHPVAPYTVNSGYGSSRAGRKKPGGCWQRSMAGLPRSLIQRI